MKTDLICGMTVDEKSKYFTEYNNQKYYFCSEHCLHKFTASPEQYLSTDNKDEKSGCGCNHDRTTPAKAKESAGECCGGHTHKVEEPQNTQHSCCGGNEHNDVVLPITNTTDSTAIYTCPMHPEIEQDHPGSCPKCGMALEPKELAIASTQTEYTCPMHPEVVQDHPGSCPKCGMALEPRTVEVEEDNSELDFMTRRFFFRFSLLAVISRKTNSSAPLCE